MTKYIKRIRDLFEYTLYKSTLYLLTYLQNGIPLKMKEKKTKIRKSSETKANQRQNMVVWTTANVKMIQTGSKGIVKN